MPVSPATLRRSAALNSRMDQLRVRREMRTDFYEVKQLIHTEMKRLLILATALMVAVASYGQDGKSAAAVRREGTVFYTEKASSSSNDITTTYGWRDSKGVMYDIYLHKVTRGENAGMWKAFVWKTTKDGKKYRHYIPGSLYVAQQILDENPGLLNGK